MHVHQADFSTLVLIAVILAVFTGGGRPKQRRRTQTSGNTLAIMTIIGVLIVLGRVVWVAKTHGLADLTGAAAGAVAVLIVAAVIWWLLPSGSLYGNHTSAQQLPSRSVAKGAAGEAAVAAEIERLGYQALHDVYLPIGNDYTQIDHIVSVGSAVIAIETKNWSGKITGDWNDAKWQIHGSRAILAGNPILQNRNHVDALQKAIRGDVRNYVIMSGRAFFPDGAPPGVYRLDQMEDCLGTLKGMFSATSGSDRQWRNLCAYVRSIDRNEAIDRHRQTVLKAKMRSGG